MYNEYASTIPREPVPPEKTSVPRLPMPDRFRDLCPDRHPEPEERPAGAEGHHQTRTQTVVPDLKRILRLLLDDLVMGVACGLSLAFFVWMVLRTIDILFMGK